MGERMYAQPERSSDSIKNFPGQLGHPQSTQTPTWQVLKTNSTSFLERLCICKDKLMLYPQCLSPSLEYAC